jgi:hypothetical protein
MLPMKRAILFFAVILILAAVYEFWVRKDMSDFGMYYRAGERISNGETLYRESDGHLKYYYSPTSALFFAAFSLIPYEWAKLLWYILQFLCLAGVFFLSLRILPVPEKKAIPVCLWTFLILLKFLGREVELGQLNLFILLALTLMFSLLLEKKEVAPGLLWATSMFFKPYALVFLPYFLVKKKSKPAGIGLSVFFAGLFLPALFYGFRGNLIVLKEWMSNLLYRTNNLLSAYDNASLYGFLSKVFPTDWNKGVISVLILLFLLLALALLWMIRTGRTSREVHRPEVLESSFLLIMIPLFSPLGWNYNYLYSFLAVMLIVSAFKKFPLTLKIILIINFAMISTSLVEFWGRTLFHFYTQYSLVLINYLVILFGLFYLRLRKIA